MRIVFDAQAIQGRSGLRGIGRYNFELIKALGSFLQNEEVILLLNESLPIPSDRISELKKLYPKASFLLIKFPSSGFSSEIQMKNFQKRMRQEVIEALDPNWVHVGSVFEGFNEPVVEHSFGDFLSSTYFFDAIPAIYPQEFLGVPEVAEWYWGKVSLIQQFDYLFAISSNSTEEAISYLQVPYEKLETIWGGLDSLSFKSIDNQNSNLLTYVGAFENRKNLPFLITAFAQCQNHLPQNVVLALVGKAEDSELFPLEKLVSELGIEKKVIFLGHLSDLDLEAVYENTRLMVYPSLHEGLGLPLLEAMARGIPAIASNRSSMATILDGLPNTFDPTILDSLKEKMIEYYLNTNLRQDLIREFELRREFYTWEKAARAVLSKIKKEIRKDQNSPALTRYKVRRFLDKLAIHVAEFGLTELENSDVIETIVINFERLLQLASTATLSSSDVNILKGHFEGNYSLSQVNRAISKISQENEFSLLSLSEHYDHESGTYVTDGRYLPERNIIEFNSHLDEIEPIGLVLRNVYPPLAHDMMGKLNIYHTWAWEESEIPHYIIEEFNNFLDGITVSSQYVQKVLINNGLKIPSCVVGESNILSLDLAKIAHHKSNVNVFTFLHISSGFPRKGLDKLLDAYGIAFSSADKVRLVIKTFPNPHNLIEEQLLNFRANHPNHAPIEIINEEMDSRDLESLFETANVLVAPSRGEGFGLPVYEALTAGIPVITTAWGGVLDFVNSENAILVDFDFALSQSHIDVWNSVWAEPRIDSLADALVMSRTRTWGFQFHGSTWLDNVNKLQKFTTQICGRRLISPKVAIISTYNVVCGIAEYTRGILSRFEKDTYIVFAAKSMEIIDRSHETELHRNWSKMGNLNQLTKAVLESGSNIVFVQYHPTFFENGEFLKLVNNLHGKVKIVVELHKLRNEKQQVDKELISIVSALLLVDRVLVHDLQDLNIMKELGLKDNVMLLQLSFPDSFLDFKYISKQKGKLTLGTSGFALPHKGQEIILEVAKLLQGNFEEVEINYYTPEHPDPVSRRHIEELSQKLNSYPKLRVKIETSFLPDNEILSNLAECDFLIYAYGETGESASGAIRHGLSSGVPVIATPSPIFDSVRGLVHTSSGYTPIEIANKVIEVWDKYGNYEVAEKNGRKVEEIIVGSSRTAYSKRIFNMFQGILNQISV